MSNTKRPEERIKQYRMTCVVRDHARPHIEEAIKILGCKNTNQLLKLGLAKMLHAAGEKRKELAQQTIEALKGE